MLAFQIFKKKFELLFYFIYEYRYSLIIEEFDIIFAQGSQLIGLQKENLRGQISKEYIFSIKYKYRRIRIQTFASQLEIIPLDSRLENISVERQYNSWTRLELIPVDSSGERTDFSDNNFDRLGVLHLMDFCFEVPDHKKEGFYKKKEGGRTPS